jgi:hypothetical protein
MGRAGLADGAARTACARVLVRGGTDEETGEALTAAAVAERVEWCAALVQGMAARLVAGHWSPAGLASLASGEDAAGRALPAMAWMALRRLGWGTAPPDGVTVNDRIIRMAQEQAGRSPTATGRGSRFPSHCRPPARPPPSAPTGHAEQRWGQASTCTPTPPRPNGNQTHSPNPPTRDN